MEEQWKDIVIKKNGEVYEYTGLYQVSNLGRVRSLGRIDALGREVKGRIMKLKVNNTTGYQIAGLSKDGEKQQFAVHRLVATMFIPNPENLPIVNHKDENPLNNCVDNLEWCTNKYNINYGTCQERASEKRKGDKNPSAKKVICLETKQIFITIKEAKQWLGKGNINTCLAGKIKTAGGYHWMYYEDYLREQRMNTDINNSKLVA